MTKFRVVHGHYRGVEFEANVIPNSNDQWWHVHGLNYPLVTTVCRLWLMDCCERIEE